MQALLGAADQDQPNNMDISILLRKQESNFQGQDDKNEVMYESFFFQNNQMKPDKAGEDEEAKLKNNSDDYNNDSYLSMNSEESLNETPSPNEKSKLGRRVS